MTVQNAYGGYEHDSIQYHFFSGDLVGAGRLFLTRTLNHGSLWIYDGDTLHSIELNDAAIRSGRGEVLECTAGGLSFVDNARFVEITSAGKGGQARARVKLTPQAEFRWDDTISTVVHQPNLAVELEFSGRRIRGVGYCKRYSWASAPHYWGYRFVQGFLDDGAVSLWTAEATFGLGKYDYFRMLLPGEKLVAAADNGSCHRQDGVFATTRDGPVEVSLQELAVWQAPLVSSGMDSLLRQRVCHLTVKTDQWVKSGMAINETCYGTLG